jgi:hypothetical protein
MTTFETDLPPFDLAPEMEEEFAEFARQTGQDLSAIKLAARRVLDLYEQLQPERPAQ